MSKDKLIDDEPEIKIQRLEHLKQRATAQIKRESVR